jgi:hypothetical protein
MGRFAVHTGSALDGASVALMRPLSDAEVRSLEQFLDSLAEAVP